MRILAPVDGKLIPFEGISDKAVTKEGWEFAIRPFGRVLYAPTEGMLEEMWADGFLLLAYGGVRVEVRLKRAGNGAENTPFSYLEALAEAGAPLTAGQVLAHLSHLAPTGETVLTVQVEARGTCRLCRLPPMLTGGRTPMLTVSLDKSFSGML